MRSICAAILLIGNAIAFQPAIVARENSLQTATALFNSVLVNDEVSTRRDWAVKSVSTASTLAVS